VRCLLILLCGASLACQGNATGELAIDLRLVDFTLPLDIEAGNLSSYRVSVLDADGSAVASSDGAFVDIVVDDAALDWAAGVRVAELDDLPLGAMRVHAVAESEFGTREAEVSVELTPTPTSVVLTLTGLSAAEDSTYDDFRRGRPWRSLGGLYATAWGTVEVVLRSDHDGDGGPDCFSGGERKGGDMAAFATSSTIHRGGGADPCRHPADPEPWLRLESRQNAGGVAADFNGDGRTDIALANGGGDVRVYYGASGASIRTLIPIARGSAITTGDVDEDGHLDLLVGQHSTSNALPALLFFGAADGFVTAPVELDAGSGARDVCVGDLDGDGHLDLVLATFGPAGARSEPSYVYLSEGGPLTAERALPAPRRPPGEGTRGCAIADLDEDGFADLVLANQVRDGASGETTTVDSAVYCGQLGGWDSSSPATVTTTSAGRPTLYRTPAGSPAEGRLALVFPSTLRSLGDATSIVNDSDHLLIRPNPEGTTCAERIQFDRQPRTSSGGGAADMVALDLNQDGAIDFHFSSFTAIYPDLLFLSESADQYPPMKTSYVRVDHSSVALHSTDFGNPWDRTFDFTFDGRVMPLEHGASPRSRLVVTADVPPGSTLCFSFRASSLADADLTTIPFEPIDGGCLEDVDRNRTHTFVLDRKHEGARSAQYRAVFTAPSNALTPILHSVRILY
jgi:hypothetical protein